MTQYRTTLLYATTFLSRTRYSKGMRAWMKWPSSNVPDVVGRLLHGHPLKGIPRLLVRCLPSRGWILMQIIEGLLRLCCFCYAGGSLRPLQAVKVCTHSC